VHGCWPAAAGSACGLPNMGLQVWLMTSKHTEPALQHVTARRIRPCGLLLLVRLGSCYCTYPSSTLGWYILLTKPMLGDL
jgi:hypothetical protein